MKWFQFLFLVFSFEALGMTATLDQIQDIAKDPAVIKLVEDQKALGSYLQGIMIEAWTNCNGRSLFHINFIEFSAPIKRCFVEVQAGACPPYHPDAVGKLGLLQCQ
jgi:hypothetical protein